MSRKIGVRVPTGDHRLDEVHIITAPNAATAKGTVAEATDTSRQDLELVTLVRDDYGRGD